MPDFVLIDGKFPHLPTFIVQHAPAFADSDEFARLSASEREAPSLVAGAFTRYVSRSYGQLAADSDERRQIHRVIDGLAESDDVEAVNILVTEMFEHVDLSDGTSLRFKEAMGTSAKRLHERWL